MTKMRFAKPLALAAALLLVAAAAASAYVLLSPRRTWDSAPNYIIDSRGLPDVNDGDGGASRTRNAIVSSSAWNGSGSGTVVNASVGSVSSFQLGDGVPMLSFRLPIGQCTGSCLAATYTGYYSQRSNGTYRIDDADIETNYSGHNWTSQGEDPNGSGCSGEIYVEGVQVHEIGHGLGLGHTNVSGATMYPSVSNCNNGPATTASDDEAAINDLYGSSGGGSFCTTGTLYTGYLSSSSDSEQEPNGTYYYSGSGTHNGCLDGPSSADFDLFLYKWNGSSWSRVASATSADSTETITYNGSSGYYTWLVDSYSGSGSYEFRLDRP